jgi:flagella basal body P-ring formation protein FlgA
LAAGIALALQLLAPAAQANTLGLPVPKVTIYPGDVIGGDQLAERAFLAHTVARATVMGDLQSLIGKVAKRTLLPGQPIPVNAIRDPYAVVQGKPTLVVYEAGGLIITAQAVALQNGITGEVISLRNVDSGIVIKGTVAADGSIRVGGP